MVSMYESLRPKTLSASMITIITLVALVGIIAYTDENSVEAQMMRKDPGGFGNISLIQAMTIAEQSIGNNSTARASFEKIIGSDPDPFAIEAFGEDRAKDLAGTPVYLITLDTPGTELYHVIVDKGNGQVLAKQELSQKEYENMHLEHSRKVVAEAQMMNNTSQLMNDPLVH
jgi:hypothetical protein